MGGSNRGQNNGGGKGKGKRVEQEPQDWQCKKCEGSDGRPFRNYGWRGVCKNCKCHKGACKPNVPDPTTRKVSLAERQQAQIRADAKAKRNAAELAKLRKDNAALLKAASGNGSESVDMDEDEEPQAEKRQARIQQLQGWISVHKDEEENQHMVDKWQAELQDLQQQRNEARPVHLRLKFIEDKLDKKEKALKRKEEVEAPKLQEAVQKAQEALDKAYEGMDVLRDQINELKGEKEQLLATPPQEPPARAEPQNAMESLEHGIATINKVLMQTGGSIVQLAKASGHTEEQLTNAWRSLEILFRKGVAEQAATQARVQPQGGPVVPADVSVDHAPGSAGSGGHGTAAADQSGGSAEQQAYEDSIDEIMLEPDADVRSKRLAEATAAHYDTRKARKQA